MARARNLKPSLFQNEVLGTADPLLTILFQSLWCLADKEGRLEDRPLRIKAQTFPYREGIDVNGLLTELERLDFIHRYDVGGLKLIQVVNFAKHQHPHHTEKDSEYPCKSTACHVTVKDPLDTSGTPSDSLNTDSLNKEEESPEPPIESSPLEAKAEEHKVLPRRLPNPWPLTSEMLSWATAELPRLRVGEWHENFIEHWTNKAGKAAMRIDWNLTWKKGMRMAMEWQDANDKKSGKSTPVKTGLTQRERQALDWAKEEEMLKTPVGTA